MRSWRRPTTPPTPRTPSSSCSASARSDGSRKPVPDHMLDQSSELLRWTVRALTEAGRDVTVDTDLETVDVGPEDLVVAIVLSATRSVVLHAVHPDYLPPEVLPAVMQVATRINTSLSTSAVELDLDTGNLSVRAGLEVGDVTLPAETFDGLVANLLDEVERVYELFLPELEESLRPEGAQTRVSAPSTMTSWAAPTVRITANN